MKHKPGDPKKAVAYIRVSTSEQHNGPDVQRAAVERWATGGGIEVVAWFEETVSGGAAIADRPVLLDALTALKTHGAGILVVQKRDRLARSTLNSALLKRMVHDAGATVVSTAGEGEGDSPEARLMATIVEAVAEWERATIAARTRAALALKKSKGELTGNAPLGFASIDGRLVPDTHERAGIDLALRLREEGMSLSAIATMLAADGYFSRSGNPYQATQVKRMLKE
jgi:DNA invertase Pin-like site-specific DNA recombinase